jgi:hypothetical protein
VGPTGIATDGILQRLIECVSSRRATTWLSSFTPDDHSTRDQTGRAANSLSRPGRESMRCRRDRGPRRVFGNLGANRRFAIAPYRPPILLDACGGG